MPELIGHHFRIGPHLPHDRCVRAAHHLKIAPLKAHPFQPRQHISSEAIVLGHGSHRLRGKDPALRIDRDHSPCLDLRDQPISQSRLAIGLLRFRRVHKPTIHPLPDVGVIPGYLFRLLEPGPELWHALNVYQLGALLHDLIMREPLFQSEYLKSTENRYRFAWIVAMVDPNVNADDTDRDLVFPDQGRVPPYDAIFVDEAQDLLAEEVELIARWSPVIFFVGDDRQKIYENTEGLDAVRKVVLPANERILQFHYRVAPEICQVADRILLPTNGKSLASTEHYNGPKPATINIQPQALTKDRQLEITAQRLQEQIRVYGDLIKQGDRLGVIVARKDDREVVFNYLERIKALAGKSKIIRSREDHDDNYDPSFESDASICILTVQGCKGLEFRAVHWPFADELSQHHKPEHYYTVVTRAKTSLDVSYTKALPQILARAHSETGVTEW